MSKRLFCIAGSIALTLVIAALASAQDSQTTTVTTQTTQTIQNADGTSTVIHYPADKEVLVDLTPGTSVPGAKGIARVLRHGNETTINLDLSNLSSNANNFNVYAVDPAGKVTLLGSATANNGVAQQTFNTALDKFMLVLSPENNLTTLAASTPVLFRSAAPQGFAVIPFAQSGPQGGAPIGERVAATSTTGATPAYNVPMLGIPGFRRGTDTEMKINFTGELTGSRANVYLEPRKDGPTTIKMRFHELKDAPAGKRYVLWAVGPNNTFHRLGQVINTGRRNEAQIQTETSLLDFGLFITTEDVNDPPPSGTIVGTILR